LNNDGTDVGSDEGYGDNDAANGMVDKSSKRLGKRPRMISSNMFALLVGGVCFIAGVTVTVGSIALQTFNKRKPRGYSTDSR
jgi:hypothetical protein